MSNYWLTLGVTPKHIQATHHVSVVTCPKSVARIERQREVLLQLSRAKLPFFCAIDIATLFGYKTSWTRNLIRDLNAIAPIFLLHHTSSDGAHRGVMRYYTIAPNWRELLDGCED